MDKKRGGQMAKQRVPRAHTCGAVIWHLIYKARGQGGAVREFSRYFTAPDAPDSIASCPRCGKPIYRAELEVLADLDADVWGADLGERATYRARSEVADLDPDVWGELFDMTPATG
jgi:hypothetical protein